MSRPRIPSNVPVSLSLVLRTRYHYETYLNTVKINQYGITLAPGCSRLNAREMAAATACPTMHGCITVWHAPRVGGWVGKKINSTSTSAGIQKE